MAAGAAHPVVALAAGEPDRDAEQSYAEVDQGEDVTLLERVPLADVGRDGDHTLGSELDRHAHDGRIADLPNIGNRPTISSSEKQPATSKLPMASPNARRVSDKSTDSVRGQNIIST